MKENIIGTGNTKYIPDTTFALEEVGADIITTVLFAFKEHLLHSSETTKKLVKPLLREIERYMDSQLFESNIGYVNKQDIIHFLVKHFDSVHSITKSCIVARQKFGKEIPMKLELCKERSNSDKSSLRLCLYLPEFSEAAEEQAENITAPLTEKFLKKGLLFYITPEYLKDYA